MSIIAEHIRVRGLVQGVGFRPYVWQLAQRYGLLGDVCNDAEGVLINVSGDHAQVDAFVGALTREVPPLADIKTIERQQAGVAEMLGSDSFKIVASRAGTLRTQIGVDAATCEACLVDIRSPKNRRYGYAFTNCTHCGPRFSIINAMPYDRDNTSMAAFTQCAMCLEEYQNPADRRFHAQPNACPQCGPKVWLENTQGERVTTDHVFKSVAQSLKSGQIVAIKGIGGFHLACAANNDNAVKTLRDKKNRSQKPLAMMMKDHRQVQHYCEMSDIESVALSASAAPIVVLKKSPAVNTLSAFIAPAQNTYGVMLPYSPLHHLLMDELDFPLVLTSGNPSGQPQCIGNDDARDRLSVIADVFLMHDRDIVNRIDDSVQREANGEMMTLRRARGLAPAPISLPEGFPSGRDFVALGAELKSTFSVLRNQQVVVSQHLGDLEDLHTWDEYQQQLSLYSSVFDLTDFDVVVDQHPEYLSRKLGLDLAEQASHGLWSVNHHHAHIAACLAENDYSLSKPPVLGIAFDGLGWGDGELRGGEFLRCDYRDSKKLGGLAPVALLGGAQAMREPWRNTWAHLRRLASSDQLMTEFASLSFFQFMATQPVATYDAMLSRGARAPLCSSAGRLFDAVAGLLGVCREANDYEGQAAITLQSLAEASTRRMNTDDYYPFAISDDGIDPLPMWSAMLAELVAGQSVEDIAKVFHCSFAAAIATYAKTLCRKHHLTTVVLSGGVMQNTLLLEAVVKQLEQHHLSVLTHREVPAGDGGISLGQAVIASAQYNNY